jgi:hypothetical protein
MIEAPVKKQKLNHTDLFFCPKGIDLKEAPSTTQSDTSHVNSSSTHKHESSLKKPFAQDDSSNNISSIQSEQISQITPSEMSSKNSKSLTKTNKRGKKQIDKSKEK